MVEDVSKERCYEDCCVRGRREAWGVMGGGLSVGKNNEWADRNI